MEYQKVVIGIISCVSTTRQQYAPEYFNNLNAHIVGVFDNNVDFRQKSIASYENSFCRFRCC